MATKNKITVVFDIGTSTVRAIAGLKTETGGIKILGFASSPSRGIKRGIILNLDEFSTIANEVITQIENEFDIEIGTINVSMSGQHVRMFNHHGYRLLNNSRQVTSDDVDSLYNETEIIDPGHGYKVFHALPGLFAVDDETEITDPVGYSGRRIDGHFNLIIAPQSYEESIKNAFGKINIDVNKIVISPVATSEAVLTADEKNEGVVLLDIGAGTTKMAIYRGGVLVHLCIIPFAGNTVTMDIREGCSVLYKQAELMKINFGQALAALAPEEKIITIPGLNGWEPKQLSFKSLAYIIQARIEEIIDYAYDEIKQSGYLNKIGAGIVLTGGSSRLPGIISLVKERTGFDVRIGRLLINLDQNVKGLEMPGNLPILGLLKYSMNDFGFNSGKQVKKRGNFLINLVRGRLDNLDTQLGLFRDDDYELK